MSALHIAAGVTASLVVGQALMLIALLLADRERRRDHRWLALALAGAAASCVEDVIEHLGLARELAWALPFTGPGLLVVGPALWLHARSITEAPGRTRPRAWLHFVPAGALFVLALLLVPLVQQLPDATPPAGRPADDGVILVPIALQLGAYLVAIVSRVRHTRILLRDEVSNLDGRRLTWLLLVAGLYGLVLAGWTASWTFSTAASDVLTNVLWLASLALTGICGIRQRNVFAPRAPGVAPATPPAPSTAETPAPKYARSAIDTATATTLRARLADLMATDKPYLESDLTLAELAGRVGATPHHLSQLFSQHLGETFFDHVNRHRVEAVKATLARPGAGGRPLLDVALECGFGSKSAFNDTFRRLTGQSPTQYRRSLPAP